MSEPISHQPAWRIPLSVDQLAQLGLLTAIVTQIENTLQICVGRMLGTSQEATRAIMGSTNIRPRLTIFRAVAQQRITDAALNTLALSLADGLESITERRNHFVHSLWAVDLKSGSISAIKQKNYRQTADPDELPELLDNACQQSVNAAHLMWCLIGEDAARSPWRDRLQ